jgi:hypothetical protein
MLLLCRCIKPSNLSCAFVMATLLRYKSRTWLSALQVTAT